MQQDNPYPAAKKKYLWWRLAGAWLLLPTVLNPDRLGRCMAPPQLNFKSEKPPF